MRIALYGHFMFELAVGLRENPDNDVRLFLDSRTLPTCLSDEPLLHDPTFVVLAPWVTYQELLRPKSAEIALQLSEFDVALVTDFGPIFAANSGTDFVFVPGGSDFTESPFPLRSWSTRPRGRRDLVDALVAARLRPAIRSSLDIWPSGPFAPWNLAAARLGVSLERFLPQAVDTALFRPRVESSEKNGGSESLTIFHPTRIMFNPDPRLVEVNGCLWNNRLLLGFAEAVRQGVDVRLVLIDRDGSSDQEQAKQLLFELGVTDRVEWLRAGTSAGFTWQEMADLYRSCDIVGSEFSGWTGLITLEGASCGKPVITYVEPDAMASMYPAGHPLIQAANAQEVCEAIMTLADPERRRSIGRLSRQWVLEHHDRSVVARRSESMLAARGVPGRGKSDGEQR